MTFYLKQSTASQELPLGPFIASADGSAQTGLTIANTDIKIWKAGATSMVNKNSGGGTHMVSGIYSAVFDATDTDTLGSMLIFVGATGSIGVRIEIAVVPANVYDSLFGADLLQVDLTQILGAAVSTSTAQIGANSVQQGGTAQTGRDLGASVLLSPGTGTGQVDITSGVIKSNLVQILGTALTETAGYIAAAFKQFFNIAAPTGTVNLTPACTNLTNAPTAGDLTATMKTSVTTAATAATPTISTLGAGAITAAAIATDAIAGAKVAADAVTKIQSGLALDSTVAKAATVALDATVAKAATVATAAELAKVPKSDSNVTFNATALASINAEVDTALNTAIPGTNTADSVNDILLDQIKAKLPTNYIMGSAVLTGKDDEIDAIKVQTDKLAFTVANQIDANVIDWKGAAAPAMTGDAYAETVLVHAHAAGAETQATAAAAALANGGFTDLLIDGIKAKTDNLPASPAAVGSAMVVSDKTGFSLATAPPTAAEIKTAVEIAGGSIALIKAKTDNLPAAPAATGDIPSAATIKTTIEAAGSSLALIKAKTDTIPTSPATEATLAIIAGYIDTEVSAIKSKTDNLPASPAATGDIPTTAAIADAVCDEALSGHTTAGTVGKGIADANNGTPPSVAAIVDGVWDEALSGHAGAGSAGSALSTASSGGVDPAVLAGAICDEALSGHTTPGTVGKALTDINSKTANLPASPAATGDVPTVGAIADAICDEALSGHTTSGTVGKGISDANNGTPPTAVAIRTEIDSNSTQISAIKGKTDNLPADPASNTQVNTRLATAGYTAPDNTGITAIKGKTDNLPASPAAVGSAMILTSAYDAAKNAASQTSVDDIPTNTEFAARTLPAADYLVEGDTLARVTLVDTVTTNTDMRGTNGAATLAAIEASTVLAKETTVAARPILTAIEGSTVLAKEATLTAITTKITRALGLLGEGLHLDTMVYSITGKLTSLKCTLTGTSDTYTETITYDGDDNIASDTMEKDP